MWLGTAGDSGSGTAWAGSRSRLASRNTKCASGCWAAI